MPRWRAQGARLPRPRARQLRHSATSPRAPCRNAGKCGFRVRRCSRCVPPPRPSTRSSPSRARARHNPSPFVREPFRSCRPREPRQPPPVPLSRPIRDRSPTFPCSWISGPPGARPLQAHQQGGREGGGGIPRTRSKSSRSRWTPTPSWWRSTGCTAPQLVLFKDGDVVEGSKREGAINLPKLKARPRLRGALRERGRTARTRPRGESAHASATFSHEHSPTERTERVARARWTRHLPPVRAWPGVPPGVRSGSRRRRPSCGRAP